MRINNLTASRNYIIAIADVVVAGGKNDFLVVLGGIGMLVLVLKDSSGCLQNSQFETF